MKHSLAIAYGAKKRAQSKKMAQGGMAEEAQDPMGSEPNEMLEEHAPNLDIHEEIEDPKEKRKHAISKIMEKVRSRHMGK